MKMVGGLEISVRASAWTLTYRIGFTNLYELKQADPIAMVKNYEQQVGKVVDPCVEDVFRCAIAQSKYKNLPPEAKQWWYWMKQRGQTTVNL